jgi:predicted ATPase
MQKIYIKNFFAIKQVELQLDKILLLIGEQASGKSTIAKLVHFFQSLPRDLLTTTYENFDVTQNLRDTLVRSIRTKFYNFFGSTKHLADFEITYTYSLEKYITLSLDAEKRLKVYFSPNLHKPIFREELPNLLKAAQAQADRKSAYEEVQFAISIKNIEHFITGLFENNRTPLFIVAGRNITVGYSDQIKSAFYGNLSRDLGVLDLAQARKNGIASQSVDLYLMSDFLEATEKIKERFLNYTFDSLVALQQEFDQQVNLALMQIVGDKINKILKGEYRQDRRGEKIYFSDAEYVELNDASSGQQESIRILQDIFLIVLDKVNAFRVIEEPEAHLYPLAQKHLIELIALMLNHTDSQAIITTHSPYILSIFNNLLYADRVANLNPVAQDEISSVIAKEFWLKSESFYAYGLKDGECRSIVDPETGLIDQNFLDEISEELGWEFDQLYHLRAKAPV